MPCRRDPEHAACTLCGKCLTCDPHPPHSKQLNVNGRWTDPPASRRGGRRG